MIIPPSHWILKGYKPSPSFLFFSLTTWKCTSADWGIQWQCGPHISFLIIFNLFLQPSRYPPPPRPVHPLTVPCPIPPPPQPWHQENVPTPPPHHTSPHQASPPPGASSFSRVRYIFSHWSQTRQSSAVANHISWSMLSGWWLSVWEISRVYVSWDCWSSYGVALLLSFFQMHTFLNASIHSSVYVISTYHPSKCIPQPLSTKSHSLHTQHIP
jgi:hypothetical protein